MTPEQKSTLNQAAQVYGLAAGIGQAAARERLLNDAEAREAVADALEQITGEASQLAADIRVLPIEKPKAE